jgi:very-short-patch-repair endonuclease
MPRYSTGKTKVATKEKLRRAQSYRTRGYTGFVDRFPLGFGTVPEKIVYEALSRRGIRFYYLNDIRLQIPEIDFDQWYQADFILPDQRIIIEVQGAHWHSMPNVIQEDAFKFALYQQTGWTPLAWWDFDILDNVNKLFMAEPRLAGFNQLNSGSSELAPVRRTKTDSSQGIRTLNQKRAQRLQYRKKAASIKTKMQPNYGTYMALA